MDAGQATTILSRVSTWFSDCFDLVFGFFHEVGYYWIIIAMIFSAAVFRLIVLPIVGGRSFDLGMDKADHQKGDRRVASVTTVRNKDGSRTGTYSYRNDK